MLWAVSFLEDSPGAEGHPLAASPRIPRASPGPAALPPTETQRAPPTHDDENFPLDVRLDVDAAPALRVVGSAQAGHVHHAALVHVHHASCRDAKRYGAQLRPRAGLWAPAGL